MGQVAVTVNGRSYRFDCGDGEEARLTELATFVKGRVEELTRQFGSGGERVLLMAALLIADELWDARAALAAKPAAAMAKEPAQEPVVDAHEPPKERADEPGRDAAAGRREQEAIRAEHRRRVTEPVEG